MGRGVGVRRSRLLVAMDSFRVVEYMSLSTPGIWALIMLRWMNTPVCLVLHAKIWTERRHKDLLAVSIQSVPSFKW